MRVKIEPGPALMIDRQRRTSTDGGIYDLTGVPPAYRPDILRCERVTALDEEAEVLIEAARTAEPEAPTGDDQEPAGDGDGDGASSGDDETPDEGSEDGDGEPDEASGDEDPPADEDTDDDTEASGEKEDDPPEEEEEEDEPPEEEEEEEADDGDAEPSARERWEASMTMPPSEYLERYGEEAKNSALALEVIAEEDA